MSKYPAFERVTAGKLQVGDSILVREGRQDLVSGVVGITIDQTGPYRVVGVTSRLSAPGGGRRSRYYTLRLAAVTIFAAAATTAWGEVVHEVSSVFRINRLVPTTWPAPTGEPWSKLSPYETSPSALRLV